MIFEIVDVPIVKYHIKLPYQLESYIIQRDQNLVALQSCPPKPPISFFVFESDLFGVDFFFDQMSTPKQFGR
jgi:hypothetical protein